MLPKRSDDGDMLLVTVDSAEVQTFMDTIKFKNPTTFDATIDIVKGKMAIWEPIEERDFLCTIASVVAKGAKIWIEVNKQRKPLGKVEQVNVKAYTPEGLGPMEKWNWKFDTRISVVAKNANLTLCVGRMAQLDDLLTTNLDQPIEYFEKVKKWEKVDLTSDSDEATLNINKWITPKLSESDFDELEPEEEDAENDVMDPEMDFNDYINCVTSIIQKEVQKSHEEQKSSPEYAYSKPNHEYAYQKPGAIPILKQTPSEDSTDVGSISSSTSRFKNILKKPTSK